MSKLVVFLTAMVFLASCTKNFDLDLSATKPKYVIEGRISNLRPPYLVRVTYSTNAMNVGTFNLIDSAAGVKGAIVTISDGAVLMDTLQPCTKDNTAGYSYWWNNGHIDSMYSPFTNPVYTGDQGYYVTNALIGVPRHTYTLSVRIGKEEFHASAYMPPVTPLDSAKMQETVIDPEGKTGWTPFAYFKEPQGASNYYLLQSLDLSDYPYDNGNGHYSDAAFPYYVFDDKTLPSYVNGMMVRVLIPSEHPGQGQFAYNYYPNSYVHVRLCSLTQEAYNYFNQLVKQFQSDGNTYQPAPATPAGNISGGALGMFYATDISYQLILP